MPENHRSDLPDHSILALVAIAIIGIIIAPSPLLQHRPGSPNGQWAALFGLIALLAPMFFSLMKRSGASENPPFWFVTHVRRNK